MCGQNSILVRYHLQIDMSAVPSAGYPITLSGYLLLGYMAFDVTSRSHSHVSALL